MSNMRILSFILPLLFTQSLFAKKEKAYIFTYFDTVHQDAGLCMAYSLDGYTWTAINDNKPIMHPTVGQDKLLRDPSVCQAPDGTFHLVWTTSWHDRIIGYAHSKDLVHWTDQTAIPVMTDYPTTQNTWAPELYYDKKSKTYYIYWASTVPGAGNEDSAHFCIYCCTTKDFKTFSKTRLWFDPGFNTIDAAVARNPKTGELIMPVKVDVTPTNRNIRVTFSRSMKKGFPTELSEPIHKGDYCEGPSPLYLANGDLIVYYDMYDVHQFGASLSKDGGKTWTDVTDKISMPEGISHGTAIAVDKSYVEAIMK